MKTFGPPRYFRLVCIRHPHGFYGGPAGYEEVPATERNVGPLIIEAWRAGEIPLHVARDALDWEETHA